MTSTLPSTSVIRVSHGNFDPARFAEVDQMTWDSGVYLIPAIRRLDGLLGYYAGASPEGSVVNVSLWRSAEHADQMGSLREMIVDARAAGERAGIVIASIVNHPIAWHI
jgi:hypothetical protein